jgi:hypothetical protein
MHYRATRPQGLGLWLRSAEQPTAGVLSQMRAMIEAQALERIEDWLRELQTKHNLVGNVIDGHAISAREAFITH